jgi:sulfate transport system permease protein
MKARQDRGPLPGFGLAGGTTMLYLGLLVLLPLVALVFKATELSWSDFLRLVFSDRALASYRLTFGAAAGAACVNLFFGSIAANERRSSSMRRSVTLRHESSSLCHC